MENSHGFEQELDKSKECYPEVLPLLDSFFASSFTESSLELDKLGSDVSDGKIHVDIKYNWKYDATNFIVEFPSPHSKGWLFSEDSICDYLLWWTTNKILLIDFKDLQKKCIENEFEIRKKYGIRYVDSDGWGNNWTVMISKVPMKDIEKHIVKEWERV